MARPMIDPSPACELATTASSAEPRAYIALVVCFAVTLLCTLLGGDAYYHLDDVTHYLFAAWSWQWPEYLLNDWGRPGFTIPYAVCAPFGLMACKIFSTVLTTASAWLAFSVAQRMALPRAWLAIPFAFAQPVYFLLAQTTLTETPLAFYLIAAVWLAQRRYWSIALAVLSVSFVTRHEAVIFAPVFVWFAWRDKVAVWKMTWLAAAPLAINFASWFGDLPVPLLKYFEPQPTRQYGNGGWLTYFQRALHAWGPTVSVLAMLGLPRLVKMNRSSSRLIASAALAYFLAQVIVFRFGLFASGGYSRFLIGISPLIAIASVAGADALLAPLRQQWRRAGIATAGCFLLLWLALERQLVLQRGHDLELPEIHHAVWAVRISAWAIAGLAMVMLIFDRRQRCRSVARWLVPSALLIVQGLTIYALHRPLQRRPDARLIDHMLVELNRLGFADREIVSAHPYIDFRTGREMPAARPTTADLIAAAPIGTLVAWEKQLAGGEDHGLSLEAFSLSPAYRRILATPPLPFHDVPYMYIFEKIDTWERQRERK